MTSAPNPTASIDVTINGERRAIASVTLAGLLDELGYGEAKVATALNGDFVPAGRRSATMLGAGDRVEVVAPRQGG